MGIVNKIAAFAASPKGRQLTEQAKAYAAKPENRRKLEQMASRLRSRGTGGSGR